MADGAMRFVLSLRGVGEGHVSSVTFRTGVWTPGTSLTIDDPGATSVSPVIVARPSSSDVAYLDCGASRSISETVLFPVLPSQRQGIEDVRLVRFTDDDGSVMYHGTCTAYSGAEARSELLTTLDFKSFEMRALSGEVASVKGMALFPRRIDGRFVTLGRQDNRSIWLNVSNDIVHWEGGVRIVEPRYPWEFVQMGNCGAPINVVYSCGSLVAERTMLLPYAVAASFTAFASLSIDNLLACME